MSGLSAITKDEAEKHRLIVTGIRHAPGTQFILRLFKGESALILRGLLLFLHLRCKQRVIHFKPC